MKSITYYFAVVALTTCVLSAQQQVRTLSQLKEAAERNYEQLQMNALAVEQAKRTTDAAAAAMLPRIDLTASYSHASEVGKIELQIPGLISRTMQFGDGNIYDAALTLSYPVFNGFRLSINKMIQEEQERIAQQALAGSRTEVRNLVSLNYNAALAAKRGTTIIAEQIDYLQELLRVRRAQIDQGQAISFDTLQLSTREKQLEVERAQIDLLYRKAMLQLRVLCGIKEAFAISDETEAITHFDDISVDSLITYAISHRSDFLQITSSLNIANYAADAARGAYYPSIVAQAAYRYGRPGVDQLKNEWMNYYTAGVRLEWNLFSFGADKANVEKQSIEVQKVDLRFTMMTKQLKAQLEMITSECEVKKQTLRLLDAQIAQEVAKQKLIDARLRQGIVTTIEMLEAETSKTSALLRRAQTEIEYNMKLIELATAIGHTL